MAPVRGTWVNITPGVTSSGLCYPFVGMYGGAGWRKRVNQWADGRTYKRPFVRTGYVQSVPRAMGQPIVYSRPYVPARATATARPAVARGFTRKSGFYGRYNQPGGASEVKFFDTTLNYAPDISADVPTGGQLNLIPQGVTQNTRVGRQATLKSVQFRGTIVLKGIVDGTRTTSADVLYMILVLDKQANGNAADPTEIFTGGDLATRMINLANSSRFTILRALQKRLVPSTESSNGSITFPMDTVVPIDFFHRCNIPIEFSSTTGALTEIKSNNLFWVTGTAVDTNESGSMALSGVTRVRFSDD